MEGDGGSPKARACGDMLLPQLWLFGASSSLPHARLPDLPLPDGISLMSLYSALLQEQRMSRSQWEGGSPKPLLGCPARHEGFPSTCDFLFRAMLSTAHAGLFFCFIFI